MEKQGTRELDTFIDEMVQLAEEKMPLHRYSYKLEKLIRSIVEQSITYGTENGWWLEQERLEDE